MDSSTQDFKELRIAMVGKTGVGKSELGNNLLQDKVFLSASCGNSVPPKCQSGTRILEDGYKLVVVDTPGLFDTRMKKSEISNELARCVLLTSPGPHVFLFVLAVGRFTNEEHETIKNLKDIFGEQVMNFVVILFTYKDKLINDEITLDEYLENSPEAVKSIIKESSDRYVAINNHADREILKHDVEDLLKVVRETIQSNRAQCYTGEMYDAAEKVFKEKLQKIEEEKHKRERVLCEKKRKLQEEMKEQIQTFEEEKEKQRLKDEENQRKNEEEKQKLEEQRQELKLAEKNLDEKERKFEEEIKARTQKLDEERTKQRVKDEENQRRGEWDTDQLEGRRRTFELAEKKVDEKERKFEEEIKAKTQKLEEEMTKQRLKDEENQRKNDEEKQKLEERLQALERENREMGERNKTLEDELLERKKMDFIELESKIKEQKLEVEEIKQKIEMERKRNEQLWNEQNMRLDEERLQNEKRATEAEKKRIEAEAKEKMRELEKEERKLEDETKQRMWEIEKKKTKVERQRLENQRIDKEWKDKRDE